MYGFCRSPRFFLRLSRRTSMGAHDHKRHISPAQLANLAADFSALCEAIRDEKITIEEASDVIRTAAKLPKRPPTLKKTGS